MAIRKYELVPPKKPPARGAKQVIKENKDVIDVCRSLAVMPSVIRIVIASVVNYRNFKLSLSSLTWDIVLSNTLLPMSLIVLSNIMKKMSKPVYSADGKIVYAGYDLNLKGSWGEIFREVMAIIVLTHLFSAISPWFRHILWLIPGRIFYLIWRTTVRPTLLQIFIESGLISEDQEEERGGGKAKKNKKKIKYLRTIRHWHNFKC